MGVSVDAPAISLGEGRTPLLPAPRLSARLGLEVLLKWEGANPTGSFKDRGMAVAISRALERGVSAVVCASTGNTAASAAAYAARAGLPAFLLQPQGNVALGKLAQARALGARVIEVRGTFDQSLAAARELEARGTHVLVNSLNPDRIDGQKSAAFEIVEQLGGIPDVLALPYGGGGNTVAYGRGFAEAGAGIPRILSVEAERRAETVATAIRIAAPVHALDVAATGAEIVSVSDEQIIEAWRALAREEGLFCEPASAAGVAALLAGHVASGSRVVCVITGHGLKDPQTAIDLAPPTVTVDPDFDAVAEAASP
jgi:threonine synthase